jgi:pyruvate-formate lyase-activating enzyme
MSEAPQPGSVSEQRHWLRITGACNNGCLFCLDSDFQPRQPLELAELLAQMDQARAAGAARLILSGGEPTTHPKYLELVAAARAKGFPWIQTISNGRMFSYRPFAAQALAAGLSEVTISMHGDGAALHDHLTAVPGAFEQALAGLRNLLGRCVVSVDVVLARPVAQRLPQVLRFFHGLGVREFDLLFPVPFGRAWEHRDLLFWRPEQLLPTLHEAFDLAAQLGLTIWTNRFPASALEGYEHLIQDPHKLLDEVRGRHEELQALLDHGRPLRCHGPRCDWCHLKSFCAFLDTLPSEPRPQGRGLPDAPPAPTRTWPLPQLAQYYIDHRWHERGRCCAGCGLAGTCPGLPIQEVRRGGFNCSRREL